MLSEKQLIDRIETLFKKEEDDMSKCGYRPAIVLNRREGLKSLVRPLPEEEIETDVPNWYLIYENLEKLLKLYYLVSSEKNLKTCFLKWIVKHIESDTKTISAYDGSGFSTNRSTSGLALYFLFRIKELESIRKAIEVRNKKKLMSDDICYTLQDILRYEHYRINESELQLIENILHKIFLVRVKLVDND